MGNEYIAEKRKSHSAIATEPDLIAPDPSKPMVVMPYITYVILDDAVDTAESGNGNQYPLYISTSHVPHCLGGPPNGVGKKSLTWNGRFQTTEHSTTVKVGPGWQIQHDHKGTINNGNANAKVVAGIKSETAAQECLAMLRLQMARMKESAAAQLSERPAGFAKDVGVGAWDTVKGYGETASDAGKGLWNAISHPIDTAGAIGGAIVDTVKSVADAIAGTASEVVDVTSAIINEELSIDDIIDGMEDLVGELGSEALCALADAMKAMCDKPEALGNAMGGLMTEVAIQVAAALVSGGAANAAAAGAKAAKASKAGAKALDLGAGLAKKLEALGIKKGDSLKDVMKRLKERRQAGQSQVPDKSPPTPKTQPPAATTPQKPEPHNNGQADGSGTACPLCPLVASPVNPVQGCKILAGDSELDFSLPGPLPLRWQRNYASNSREIGWYGQGWASSFGMVLEEQDNEEVIDFIDSTGRRIHFPRLAPGREFFSRYEHTTLARSQAGEYSLVASDGSRLFFGQRHPQQSNRLLCTGQADANDNRISLEYQPAPPRQDAAAPAPQAQPCYLLDSSGEALQLDYHPGGRLLRVSLLSGLSPHGTKPLPDPKLRQLLASCPSVAERLVLAARYTIPLLAHTLVEYRYSNEGNLVSVERDGQERRRYQWRDHILVGHAVPGGLEAHYEYDRYDAGGKVIRHWSNAGQQWSFEYGVSHTRVIEAQGSPDERITLYHFDEQQRWTGTTDALGGRTTYTLDQYGNRVALTNPDGITTRYSLDTKGRPIAITDALGQTSQVIWHSELELPTQLIDALGQAITLEYDARGNLITQIDPAGHATRFELDARGLPVRITDAKGGIKQLHWNAHALLIAYTDCSQQTTRFSYTERGWLSRQTDPLGASTHYHYAAGQLSRVDYPDQGSEHYEYDRAGRLIAHIDPLGRRTRYDLGADGLPTARIDALGGRLGYEYDRHRRLVRLVNQNGTPWQFQYDRLDRLVAETNFEGKFSAYAYSAAGHLQSQRELPANHPDSILTRFERDALGRLLTRHTQAAGQASLRTRYQYDPAGNLIGTSNAEANSQLEYDALGQLSQEIHTTHWRDAEGKRQPRSQHLRHRYDPLGNRFATTLPDGRTLNWLHYGSGHLHQINLDGELISDMERDAAHREIRRSQGALQSDYQLDAMGRLLDHRVSSVHGATASAQPLVGAGLTGSRIARQWRYDRAGQLLEILDARRGSTQYHYDALSRILHTATPQHAEQFAFDPAHNLLPANQTASLKDNRVTVFEDKRYRYDSHGRLVEKRSGSSHNSTILQLHWNADHQLVQATTIRSKGPDRASHISETHYGYDAMGRRMSRQSREWLAPAGQTEPPASTTPGQSAWFVWDGNRLLQEILVNPAEADPANRSQTHTTVYEPNSFIPLARLSWPTAPADTATPPPPQPDWMRENIAYFDRAQATYMAQREIAPDDDDFVPKSNQPTADDGIAARTPMQIAWYQCDHLGTPQELTAANGEIVWQASYKTWGNTATLEWVDPSGHPRERARQSTTEHAAVQPLRFQGQYFDAETGLHYNRFRYYDPDVGRFISNDPIGLAGGENIYQYAPNPLGWVDPLGLEKCKKCDGGEAECKKLLASIYQKSLGRKSISGSRGVLERVEHLLHDKASIYDYAKNLADKRTVGPLAGMGTYQGHIEQATQLQKGLRDDIQLFETSGCNKHYKIPLSVRRVADMAIPQKPAGR
ncbi:hypothetical protein FNU76_12035 [Chitinimonas arctica]|uniref:Type IV secretion protein Rhs n=1 Tax=Chitinimonas arctica TaxID=2594795 RepID=A0A516SFU3_9NEIS|nr:RHS repeat-associated core domain-containing protein [Chitinimonas arctica]QDQ27031.1 hypothetical protein FNU76_12035 [Chitinimonas arctica]